MTKKILKETMAENFLNFAEDINLKSHKAEQTPNRLYPKKYIPTQLTMKLMKLKYKKKNNS